jgi:hypothetical protein
MATEGNVAINADSVATGAHNVRTVKVTPVGQTTNAYEEQQVVSIADDNGVIVGSEDGALSIHDSMTHRLLRAMIVRLDILNARLDKNYIPPDDFYLEEK